MNLAVVTKYADVLYDWCAGSDTVDEAGESLAWLCSLLEGSRDFRFIWLHPVVASDMKKEILEPALRDLVSPAMWSFMCLLMDRRREGLISAVREEFDDRVRQARGVKTVDVFVADHLPEDLREDLRQVLSDHEAMDVALREHRDPAVMAGLVIRIDDLKMDGSLRGRLRSVQRLLSAASDGQMLTGRDEDS